jgi:hypothetical protein
MYSEIAGLLIEHSTFLLGFVPSYTVHLKMNIFVEWVNTSGEM